VTTSKNTRLIVFLCGFAFLIIAVLIMVVNAKTKRYSAIITEVTDTYTTRKSGKKTGSRKSYNETVTVQYVNKKGDLKEASGIRIKRGSENSLPKVGDTIYITKGFFKMKEHTSMTSVAFTIAFVIMGLALIISGFRSGRGKPA